MKRNVVLSLLGFFLVLNGTFAQNSKLYSLIKNVSDEPGKLPKLENDKNGNWKDYTKKMLYNFLLTPREDEFWDDVYLRKPQNGDNQDYKNRILDRLLSNPFSGISTKEFTEKTKLILESPELIDLFYSWVKPYFLEIFSALPLDIQDVYIDFINHAQNYLGEVDFNDEIKYLTKLGREKKEEDFIQKNSDGKANKYRKLEAWLFRRYLNGARKKDLFKLTVKIETDFISAKDGQKYKYRLSKVLEKDSIQMVNKLIYHDLLLENCDASSSVCLIFNLDKHITYKVEPIQENCQKIIQAKNGDMAFLIKKDDDYVYGVETDKELFLTGKFNREMKMYGKSPYLKDCGEEKDYLWLIEVIKKLKK